MVSENPRRSIRLRSWDYRNAGAYFLTIVTYNREPLLGSIHGDEVSLSPYGEIVQTQWLTSPEHRPEIELDEFVVMPNHVHGIAWIKTPEGMDSAKAANHPVLTSGNSRPAGATPRSLGAFVAGFKAASTKEVNRRRNTPGAPLWQRNYHERIIRNERELDAIRAYVQANPMQWAADMENHNSAKVRESRR